jgi:ADP-ribose pyrophosphatase YjhB (NUDIX family)
LPKVNENQPKHAINLAKNELGTLANQKITSKKESSELIPLSLYDRIVDCLPIVSVEAVIVDGDSLLFLKRNNPPVKDRWWFAGGRIRKGETLEEALVREVKEETGLQVIESKLVNVYSRIFDERHDITIAYLCRCNGNKIILNNEHSEYKYFKKPPKNMHPYLKQVINDLEKKSVLYSSSIWKNNCKLTNYQKHL